MGLLLICAILVLLAIISVYWYGSKEKCPQCHSILKEARIKRTFPINEGVTESFVYMECPADWCSYKSESKLVREPKKKGGR